MNAYTYALSRRRGESHDFCGIFDSREAAIKAARDILESEDVQSDFDEQMAIGEILSDWTTFTDGYEDFTVTELDLTIPNTDPNSYKIVFQTH
jgi:hypothetical protein